MLPNLLRTPWASRAWGTTRTLLVAFLTATTLLLGTPLASASTPGSNGRIVYSADFGTEAQMFTIWGNGTGIRQITNEAGAAHVHPDWSPFGRRLAYELDTAEQAGISVARPDGIRFRTIHAKGFLGQPAFTADGRHILFSW